MRRKAKFVLLLFGILAAAVQLVPVEKTNPAAGTASNVRANTQIPSNVAAIIERSCSDCHSNRTRWPWYSHVAPVSWFLANHVTHGRQHLNFSDWLPEGGHGPRDPAEKLERICRETAQGEMPLGSYTLVHPGARLTADDVRALCEWTQAERRRLSIAAAAGGASASQGCAP